MMLKKLIIYLFLLLFCCLLTGCNSEGYKSDADQEVYKIIDDKWNDKYGSQANYKISVDKDAPNQTDPNETESISGKITLSDAVKIATHKNRDYLTQKEALYISALDLTLQRHQYTRQWFGTIDTAYTKNGSDETIGSGTEVGFNQQLADGAAVSASIAVDWLKFLTGDPRTSLGSVLPASISQPLLRGAGKKIAQENLTQAERNTLYQIRTFNRYRQSFVVSIVSNYYRTLQGLDIVKNAQANYDSLQYAYNRAVILKSCL